MNCFSLIKAKFLLGLLILFQINLGFSQSEKQQSISNFNQSSSLIINQIRSLRTSLKVKDWYPLIESIKLLQKDYANLDRKNTPLSIQYSNQFKLRLINSSLKSLFDQEYRENRLSKEELINLYYLAHLNADFKERFHKTPQTVPPIKGVSGTNFPLDHWIKEPDYYNYTFDGDQILFRDLRIQSGDLIFNYTTEKPVGIFTAIGENQSLFPHVSMVIFLNSTHGRIPLAVDVVQQGVRIVPLHHFLGNNIAVYAEVFRLKNQPSHFKKLLEPAFFTVTSKVYPYDLVGSADRSALSCPELVDYILEMTGQETNPLFDQIKLNIHNNILKFGYFNRNYLMPNDFILTNKFDYVGYVDNSPPIYDIIINDLLMGSFRDAMDKKIVKSNRGPLLKLTTHISTKMQDPDSNLGHAFLKLNNFSKENFPVGDPGLLGAIGVVDISFKAAMSSCIHHYKNQTKSDCFKELEFLTLKPGGIREHQYSVDWWRSQKKLKSLINNELTLFNDLFEVTYPTVIK